MQNGFLFNRIFKNLRITEEDTGDGWTKVKVIETGAEGFVPTSYISARPWDIKTWNSSVPYDTNATYSYKWHQIFGSKQKSLRFIQMTQNLTHVNSYWYFYFNLFEKVPDFFKAANLTYFYSHSNTYAQFLKTYITSQQLISAKTSDICFAIFEIEIEVIPSGMAFQASITIKLLFIQICKPKPVLLRKNTNIIIMTCS